MPPPLHRPAEPLIGPVFSSFRLPVAEGAARLMLVGELDLVTAERAHAAIRSAQREAPTLICCPAIVPRILRLLELGDVLEIEPPAVARRGI